MLTVVHCPSSVAGNTRGYIFIHDPPVEKVNGAIGVTGEARGVRHHAEGSASLMLVAQQLPHRFAILGVQVSSGLIGQ